MAAYEDAVRSCQRALDLLGSGQSADEPVRCELLLALAEAQMRTGDAPGARERDLEAARIPTPFHWEMKNQQNGSHTVVEFTEIKYDTGLSDDMFTQRALERGL